MIKQSCLISAVLAICGTPLLSVADGLDGNRYSADLVRDYKSEISASAAYLAAVVNDDAVIIDVRTIEEYVGGHPEGAYSIPFPHVTNRQRDETKPYAYIPQDPAAFVAAVNALGLDKNTQIITMCRTGFRSVLAGNLLAADGYTNVQNMWEGFKGRLKQNVPYDTTISGLKSNSPKVQGKGEIITQVADNLDLDNDGEVDGSDPYSMDLDGWANFAGLPVNYDIDDDLISLEYEYIYDEYEPLGGER